MTRGARLVALALALAILAELPGAARSLAAPRAGLDVHLVKAGDTLIAIAARYGVTVASLVAANRLPHPRVRLRVGQRLTIPARVTKARRAVTAVSPSPLRFPPRTLVLAVPDFTEMMPFFSWPVDGPVSSTFGRRRMGWHQGIDIQADLGTPVAAAATGTVVGSGYEPRYGRVIKVEHINGFLTVYAHNDENLVEPGERVMLGQVIAAAGRTGRATANHVHFEIRQAGYAYNPLYMLPLPSQVSRIEDNDEEEPETSDE
jgi:murein DD-endopeptidase MepM/ murein hydrolase activator NlpD